jgi:ABC-type antimicrobial peptide transport system permease subunit
VIVRHTGDAAILLPRLQDTIRRADPRMIVTATSNMEELVADSVSEERLRATLSSVFGGAALLLAALGLYGLASRLVVDRRHEIGVRVALGARPTDVGVLVLRSGLIVVTVGAALGLPAALGLSQVMATFLFGVSPTAPHVFAIAIGFLTMVALVATLLPALRAARIDPAIILRDS